MDRYKKSLCYQGLAYGLTGYKYLNGVNQLEIKNPKYSLGCLVRIICSMGNPGFYIAQIEIIRKETGKWVIYSTYTKEEFIYNSEFELPQTIRIVLEILIKRGQLNSEYLSQFDTDYSITNNILPPELEEIITDYSGDHLLFSGAYDYLFYHTLLMDTPFKKNEKDDSYSYSDKYGSIYYKEGDDMEVRCNGEHINFYYTIRAAFQRFITDY